MLLAADLESKRIRQIATVDGDEQFFRRSSTGGRILGTPPIRRSTVVAVGQAVVAVGDSDSGLVRVVNLASGNQTEIYVRDGNRTLTEAGIQARLDEILRERPTAVSPQWERLQREMISAQRFPAFGDVRMDGEDRVWIQRWDRARQGGQSWLVLDLSNNRRYAIDLPRYCRPTQIVSSLLTCVNYDPSELQSARSFRLEESSR